LDEYHDWAETKLRGLVVEATQAGAERARLEIARGSLGAIDCLPSHLCAALGEQFDAIYPNAGALFPDGIDSLLTALLMADADTQEALAGWYLLRDAGGDAPLPAEIAKLARERGKLLDLSSSRGDLETARHLLLTFTALAAVNGWHDESDRIDAAASALGPRPEDDDVMVMFEIAIWRSRLIASVMERTQFLSQEFLRLARHEPSRTQAILAARHFARSLSGQQAEAFVDAMGQLIATH
jgi:hypothetical protein